MAKPEPLPVVKGPAAKNLAQRLKKPAIAPEAKELYRGALEEYREVERKRKGRSQ